MNFAFDSNTITSPEWKKHMQKFLHMLLLRPIWGGKERVFFQCAAAVSCSCFLFVRSRIVAFHFFILYFISFCFVFFIISLSHYICRHLFDRVFDCFSRGLLVCLFVSTSSSSSMFKIKFKLNKIL